MRLQLNGETIDAVACSLADLLEAQGFGGAKIATAVNGCFVPSTVRADHSLTDGDMIEVLAPMQGG
ncbi:MAG: sulfur carrier protein ThiS [Octadecabacter sp.]|nr:sulfur carrier protein ThiS [Octadecabacter sp.]